MLWDMLLSWEVFLSGCGELAGYLNFSLCSVTFSYQSKPDTMANFKFSFVFTLLFPCLIPVDPGCSLEDLPKCF